MKVIFSSALIFAVLFCFSSMARAKQAKNNPIEVGNVQWGRDFKGALAISKVSEKPLFLLFQEVPGCIGCQNFGQNVLTHPLLVEAIEDEFIPVLVFNNRAAGQDAELIKLFEEPSWNFQVIRFIDANGKDVIARQDKIWSISGVAKRMIDALQSSGRSVPLYLQAVALETDKENIGTAVFSMACFWTGEYKLGKIDGVVGTEAGWYEGREVTLVRYHKKEIDLAQLVDRAAKERCAQTVYLEKSISPAGGGLPIKKLVLQDYRTASQSDQKKQLQDWMEHQKGLDLTPMQMMKLNSLMPDDIDLALSWLSSRQLKRLK